MADYSGWLQRAVQFMRGSSQWPGEWSMKLEIQPPLALDEVEEIEHTLPHAMPPFLRDFYLTASADAECRYSWSPYELNLHRLRDILPYNYSIYGGPSFCDACNYLKHCQVMLEWAEIFEEHGEACRHAAEVMREATPLVNIGNGDCLIYHATAKTGDAQVLYVNHESDMETESPLVPIARTGEEFMAAWEYLGYLGPEIWLLAPFLEDSPTGLFVKQSPLSLRWRTLLHELGNI